MDPVRLKTGVRPKPGLLGRRVRHSVSPRLPRRTKSAQHVKESHRNFSPGGGYVFNQIHNIQADVPPENIIAMFDAAHEFGGYGGNGQET